MEITLPFELGQYVFIMKDNKVSTVKIKSVTVHHELNKPISAVYKCGDVKMGTFMDDLNSWSNVKEYQAKELFSTKEDLLKSL